VYLGPDRAYIEFGCPVDADCDRSDLIGTMMKDGVVSSRSHPRMISPLISAVTAAANLQAWIDFNGDACSRKRSAERHSRVGS